MADSVGHSEFYDAFPSSDHEPGDVWLNLPTFGMLPQPRAPGLVITPACDLANRKVETVTYLPILPVKMYLISRGCISDIQRIVDGQLTAGGVPIAIKKSGASAPSLGDIEAALSLLNDHMSRTLGAKEQTACERALDGLNAVQAVLTGRAHVVTTTVLQKVFGQKEFTEIARRIVTNSYRSDIHFLPQDGQREEWSAIKWPSIALFRYPMTIPIDLLDEAQGTSDDAWDTAVERYSAMYPGARVLVGQRPVKYLRVRQRFVPDLISRFTSLYVRIGSPDFTAATVERLVTLIGNTP